MEITQPSFSPSPRALHSEGKLWLRMLAHLLPTDVEGCRCWSYPLHANCSYSSFFNIHDSCFSFHSQCPTLEVVLKEEWSIYSGPGKVWNFWIMRVTFLSNRSSLKGFKCTHSNYMILIFPILFFITTSPCRGWVSCVSAAFLQCGSHFLCSFSRIERWFLVIRCNHGRHVTYYRHLMGQRFQRCDASTWGHVVSSKFSRVTCGF